MRLLHIDTWKLEEFHGDPPPYAITSHRWTPEEVSFQELSSQNPDVHKAGFRKVHQFCAAVKDLAILCPQLKPKLEYIWIDTCCIDKTNSVELSEALNSMFKWYASAEVCLAFLHDVTSLNEHPTTVELSIMNSVWFTRGWTLQELLAPKRVLFYNRKWEILGRKRTVHETLWITARAAGLHPLNEMLARRTGIPVDVLYDFSKAENLSIDEKRSWMKGRATSRLEDRVYCQLGIFGVFMPLIYGEGEHANVRLEDAIAQKDRHLKASSTRDRRAIAPAGGLEIGIFWRPPAGGKWRRLTLWVAKEATVAEVCESAVGQLERNMLRSSQGFWKLATFAAGSFTVLKDTHLIAKYSGQAIFLY